MIQIQKKDSWTKNGLNDRKTQEEWIKNALIDLTLNENQIIECNKFLSNFETLYDEILRIANEKKDEIDEEIKDNIGNLTLLDAGTNRSYKNALFSTKRRKIIEKDKLGVFILHPQNIFYKNYSP